MEACGNNIDFVKVDTQVLHNSFLQIHLTKETFLRKNIVLVSKLNFPFSSAILVLRNLGEMHMIGPVLMKFLVFLFHYQKIPNMFWSTNMEQYPVPIKQLANLSVVALSIIVKTHFFNDCAKKHSSTSNMFLKRFCATPSSRRVLYAHLCTLFYVSHVS